MFIYKKTLQYPVKIANPNPALAKFIISQYGGPDGELGASLRYLSQRFSMPWPELRGLLTDIGTEGSRLHTGAKNPCKSTLFSTPDAPDISVSRLHPGDSGAFSPWILSFSRARRSSTNTHFMGRRLSRTSTWQFG